MTISAEQLGEWMNRWAGPLRSWLRERCQSPDDIVQEAFCRLVQQSTPPERVQAWLFQVASNLAKEERRRGQREARRAEWVAIPEALLDQPERGMEAAEIRWQVELLSEELREVVIARLWGDLTYQEIAPLVGASVATVHRRYEQALIKLRSVLRQRLVTES